MLKVLIVEDDLMIADPAEDIIVENGYKVCGIAHTLMQGTCNHPAYDTGTFRIQALDLAMHQVRQHPSGSGPDRSGESEAVGWHSGDLHAPTQVAQ
jgi:hypothetical protein